MIHECQPAEGFEKGMIPNVLGAYPKECFRFTENFLRMTFANAWDLSEDEDEMSQVTQHIKEQAKEQAKEQVREQVGEQV